MEKNHKKIYLLIAVICFATAVGSVIYLAKYFQALRKGEADNEALREQIELSSQDAEEQQTAESTASAESTEAMQETLTEQAGEAEDALLRRIDFSDMQANTNEDIYSWIYIPDTNIDYPVLQHSTDDTYYLNHNMDGTKGYPDMQANTNEDIYSWIYIPDTNIDYPVLQHSTDDTYYLNHNMDGTKGYPGCIYTESANSKEFADFNTILYGHKMKNGSMFHDLHKYADAAFLEEHPYVYVYLPDRTLKYQIFAAYRYDDRMKNGSMFHDLHKYADAAFLEEHPYVYVYLPDRTLKYQIFAAYRYDDRHLLYSFDYSSEKVREGYLQNVFSIRDMSAVIDDAVEVTSDDHIITMSTCIGGQDTKRLLVQAVLLEEGINE